MKLAVSCFKSYSLWESPFFPRNAYLVIQNSKPCWLRMLEVGVRNSFQMVYPHKTVLTFLFWQEKERNPCHTIQMPKFHIWKFSISQTSHRVLKPEMKKKIWKSRKARRWKLGLTWRRWFWGQGISRNSWVDKDQMEKTFPVDVDTLSSLTFVEEF